MKGQIPTNYYTSQKAKLLRRFDKFSHRVRKSLTEQYDADFARRVVEETRLEFERILPELPYIGGIKNFYTPIIIVNGWIISLYRVMKSHGKTVEEVVKIYCAVADDYFKSFPHVLLRLGGRLAFVGIVQAIMKRQAAQSQKRLYPDDSVYTVVVGSGDDFDWGLEFSECAVIKLYEAQGAEELEPYCNFFDVIASRYMGMGIDADSTIGLGCETCTLVYKKGRATKIPPPLKEIMPSLEE
jgi:hypothetical protein